MKDITPIVQMQHGSLLYGTNTPLSDLDLKGVHLPSGRAILLQAVKQSEDVIDRKIKVSTTKKNSAEDVDDQSFSLSKYLHMITKGDTNAIEMLFAPEHNIVFADPLWDEVRSVGRRLINRKCRGFVGYVQRQVSTYSVKGGRLKTVQEVLTVLEQAVIDHGTTAKLLVIDELLDKLSAQHEFCSIQNIESQGKRLPHFICVDRKMPFFATIKSARDLMAKVLDEYGDRARRAMQNDNVDWKAVAHAVRIAEEAAEVLRDGVITFPRPNAAELLSIRRGEHNYDAMGERIQMLVNEVEDISISSLLPEESDLALLNDFVFCHHLNQVVGR